MRDMWHSVSHTFRTINSPKGIRLGEKIKEIRFFPHVLIVEERGRRRKEFADFFLRSTKICWSKSVGPRIKVRLHDEGFSYIPKMRDFTEGLKEGIWVKSRVAG